MDQPAGPRLDSSAKLERVLEVEEIMRARLCVETVTGSIKTSKFITNCDDSPRLTALQKGHEITATPCT